MYVLSHWVTAVDSGLWSHAALAAGAAVPLALPDITGHHTWGYQDCRWPRPLSASGRLFRAHFLGDWFIHYGASGERIKRGWAYRRAGGFARRYKAFFAEAAARGLRGNEPPDDSVRGFSHTMVEYALDLYLAQRADAGSVLVALKRLFASLDDPAALLAAQGADHDATAARAEAGRWCARVASARSIEELAIGAGVEKFGLHPSRAAAAYLREALVTGLGELDSADIDAALSATSAFIAAGLAANDRAVAGTGERTPLWA